MTRPTSWCSCGQDPCRLRQPRCCDTCSSGCVRATPNSTRCGAPCGRRSCCPSRRRVSFAVGGGIADAAVHHLRFGGAADAGRLSRQPAGPRAGLRGLGFNGAVLITLGTLVAPHPWLSVALMFVLGVAVTFSGVLSEIVAAGQRATLLTFVLPACTPSARSHERLLGWLIALAVCVPAALVPLPAAPSRRAAPACGARVQPAGRPAGGHRVRTRRSPRR